jgi:hypothetical protein
MPGGLDCPRKYSGKVIDVKLRAAAQLERVLEKRRLKLCHTCYSRGTGAYPLAALAVQQTPK